MRRAIRALRAPDRLPWRQGTSHRTGPGGSDLEAPGPKSRSPVPAGGLLLVALICVLSVQPVGAHRRQPPSVQPTATPPRASGPFPPRTGPVHLPVVTYLAEAESCRGWVAVQNVGAEAGQAALVVWGPEDGCAPHCVGPIQVRCSGLLAPGGTWFYHSGALPAGAHSAAAYSFNVRPAAVLQLPGDHEGTVADLMCDTVLREIILDCDEYRRFRAAYDEAGSFAGIRLARAYGPELESVVWRACPAQAEKTASVAASYTGVSGPGFGGFDRFFDVSSYHATVVHGGQGGLGSIFYIQNGGEHCASIELWLEARNECRQPRFCDAVTLAQGASVALDAAACVGPGWSGSAWLNSTEPLAIVVDTVGPDSLTSYTAVPAELRYGFDEPPLFTEGSRALAGPLAQGSARPLGSEQARARVHVQNLSSLAKARVRVVFRSAAGDVVAPPQMAWVCPRGSRAFDLPGATAGDLLPGMVQVESFQGLSDEGRIVEPPNVSAVVELARPTGAALGPRGSETVVYPLPPDRLTSGSRVGLDGEPDAVLTVPAYHAAAEPWQCSTGLTIANTASDPGYTNAVIALIDQNGHRATACRQLRDLETVYVDPGELPPHGTGFVGSAIVSATVWSHDRRGAVGALSGSDEVVGLSAVALQRIRIPDGDGVADLGDIAGATIAQPIRRPSARLVELLGAAAGSNDCPTLPLTGPERRPPATVSVYVPLCYAPALAPDGAERP